MGKKGTPHRKFSKEEKLNCIWTSVWLKQTMFRIC